MQKPSCEYCGRCLSVCPSYQHHLTETMSPRARVDLCAGVEDQSLTPGPRFGQSLNGCLQCLACTDICGKGVDGAAIVLEARLKQGMGKPSLARWMEKAAVTWLLPRRRWLTRVVRMLARMQHFLPLESRGTVRHVPDMLLGGVGQRSLPPLARQSLFAQLSPQSEPAFGVPVVGEVAIFAGCFGGVVNTDAAQALVRLLQQHGYRVHLPADQSCCAAPALLSGFASAFYAAQLHNAQVFSLLGSMPVLSLCATCHRTLTHSYGDASYTSADAALVQSFASRIVDAAVFCAALPLNHLHNSDARREFQDHVTDHAVLATAFHKRSAALDLAQEASQEGLGKHSIYRSGSPKIRVAIHDPCHMRLSPECGAAARQCLAALPHVEVIELPVRGQCCGGGGVSSLKNPEIADSLGQARALMVLEAGVDVVVAQCPGCVLQLNNHLSRLPNAPRAQHLMEFIGKI